MKNLNIMFKLFFLVGIIATGIDCGSLYKEVSQSRQELACCQGDEVLSCQTVTINMTSLGSAELELEILDKALEFQGMVDGSSNSYHYGNKEADAVMTLHKGDLYGHFSLANGESFVIEYCGDDVHVVKKLDVEHLGENIGVDFVEDDSTRSYLPVMTTTDRSTIATYTVKVYYTQQFAAVTADIEGFIEQVVGETNQGYINSQVPLRVKAVCSEQATIDDESNPSSMLNSFRNMKGTTEALRGSADSAALLVSSFGACGIGYINTITSGNTVSVTKKSCALGYFSFGHELGHNIGLHHNPEEVTNPYYSYGHGHLIAQGTASTGFRTILAYYACGHKTRVNYYSNPNVIYPGTGTPTGMSGVSDNAQVLTQNRFALAAVGDESECPDATAIENCVLEGVSINDNLHYISGPMTESECFVKCAIEPDCLGWINWSNTIENYCYIRKFSTTPSDYAGPDLTKRCCHLDTSCIGQGVLRYTLIWFTNINTPDAASCHVACKQSEACAQWQWKQDICEMYKVNDFSASYYTSGSKYC